MQNLEKGEQWEDVGVLEPGRAEKNKKFSMQFTTFLINLFSIM